MSEAIELVFIPCPGVGHLISAVEMAKLLLQKKNHLSISVLIIKFPFESKTDSYIDSQSNDTYGSRLKFIKLSTGGLPPSNSTEKTNEVTSFRLFIESHRPQVKDCVNEIKKNSASVKVAGLVVDMFCVSMMDVAEELGLPTYVFYTCGAAMLGLHLHIQSLRDDHAIDVTEFKDSDPDLNISTYSKPFPAKLLPPVALDKAGGSTMFLDVAKRIREAKGIIVNTFLELETHALESLSKDERVPPVYPVGPILNLKGDHKEEILTWLDSQPASSVVFLCFGSRGSFPESQVKEIAHALERSGHRFLWALRRPPSEGSILPTDYDNMEEVMPEGFLERTKSTGKVIGWAPQAAVLAHPAVGGFVSHCGWNSTLESVWFGVPMGTWPIYAEQHGNAFLSVKEIGMGVAVKMDYKRDPFLGQTEADEVNAEEIEIGIKNLMDDIARNPARIKAQELKELSRKALEESGSSLNYVECFLEHVINNLSS